MNNNTIASAVIAFKIDFNAVRMTAISAITYVFRKVKALWKIIQLKNTHTENTGLMAKWT